MGISPIYDLSELQWPQPLRNVVLRSLCSPELDNPVVPSELLANYVLFLNSSAGFYYKKNAKHSSGD